jgi:hypothetical protein
MIDPPIAPIGSLAFFGAWLSVPDNGVLSHCALDAGKGGENRAVTNLYQ